MSNKYYMGGSRHAERVQDLFGTIARRYDLINDLQSFGLHRYWKRELLALAKGQPGQRVLDLCCGTGDIALAFASRGLEVTGLDFSEPMLNVAAKRIRKHRTSSVQFLRGDAQKIPFPDESFDIVSVSYGLRNLVDWQLGLSEMHRVARPGGRLLVLDFGKPENALWRGLYFSYLRYLVPLMGRFFCGDPHTHGYILESLTHYTAQKGVDAKMREMGLDTRMVNFMGGVMSINYAEKPR